MTAMRKMEVGERHCFYERESWKEGYLVFLYYASYLKYTDEVLLSCSFKFELRQSHPGTFTRIATKFIT